MEKFKKVMEEIAASMFVDNLISGCSKKEEVIELIEITTKIFREGGFTLHSWHTNCSIESHASYHEIIEHQFTKINHYKITRKSSPNIWRCVSNIREYHTKRKQRNIKPRRYYIYKATVGYEINRHQNFTYPLEREPRYIIKLRNLNPK